MSSPSGTNPPIAAALAASPGCGKTTKSAALPALRSIITCCSKLSDPPYSKVAPVAFSNIAPTSLIISCSGDNHGPNITTF